MDWILVLIKNIDTLVFYFTPGYICIYLLKLFRGKGRDDNNIIIIKSLVVSYVLQLLYKTVFKVNNINEIKHYIGVMLISIISSYLFYIALKMGIIDVISRFLQINRSTSSNIVDGCIDTKYGTWVTVYMKEDKVIYQGQMRKW